MAVTKEGLVSLKLEMGYVSALIAPLEVRNE